MPINYWARSDEIGRDFTILVGFVNQYLTKKLNFTLHSSLGKDDEKFECTSFILALNIVRQMQNNFYDLANNARRCSVYPRNSIYPSDVTYITFNELPDKLILKIFSYLTQRDLFKIAVVCRKWYQIAHDSTLWQYLNLRQDCKGLAINSTEVFLDILLPITGSTLKYIEMASDLITIPVLEELANRSPQLKYLILDFSNAMQLHDFNDLTSFPASLYYLCICLSDVIFMEGLMRKIYQFLSSLEVLHLIGTFEMSSEEEEEIYEVINISKIKAHTPNLRVINLYGIGFVDDSHVELLANNCIHLETVALNFCLKVKGSSLRILLERCNKMRSLIMQHCGLQDKYMVAVNWEKAKIEELDITSTELSSSCLEDILLRIQNLKYLAVGHCDFFTDKILGRMMENGNLAQIRAIDLSYTPSLTETPVLKFLCHYGPQLTGVMLQGKASLAEYFWTNVIHYLKNIRICVLGAADGWFYKYNTRVHIDQIVEGFAQHCPFLESLEIQWDPDTIRFSDKSRKFIDHIRLKCSRLKTYTLSDGKYYEMVKSNFERADKVRVVRTTTSYTTSIVTLLRDYRDLMFN